MKPVMIKSLLLTLPFTGLLVFGGCAQSRSMETAQKAPALQPQAKDLSLNLPQSSVSVTTIPVSESAMHLAIDQY